MEPTGRREDGRKRIITGLGDDLKARQIIWTVGVELGSLGAGT